jgi:L-asparaginase
LGSSGYTSGQVTIDAMINAVPGVMKSTIKGEQISNVGSQDMVQIMLKLAKRINELAAIKIPTVL